MHAKPFYMHESQCTQILSLLRPDITTESVVNDKSLIGCEHKTVTDNLSFVTKSTFFSQPSP